MLIRSTRFIPSHRHSLKPSITRAWIRQASLRRDLNSGLTLIEGLVAVMVITITIVSVTPPIFWATGSRVQSRKAEQALHLAQGEIDRVRTLIERNGGEVANLPPIAGTEDDVRDETKVGAPTLPKEGSANKVVSTAQCNSTDNGKMLADDGKPATVVGTYIQVDTDADCRPDFLLQTFRSQGLDQNGAVTQPTTAPSAFIMGVRVYAAIAKSELSQNRGGTSPASLKGTTGLGNQRNQPLTVLFSTIVSSRASSDLDLYRQLCPPTQPSEKPRC